MHCLRYKKSDIECTTSSYWTTWPSLSNVHLISVVLIFHLKFWMTKMLFLKIMVLLHKNYNIPFLPKKLWYLYIELWYPFIKIMTLLLHRIMTPLHKNYDIPSQRLWYSMKKLWYLIQKIIISTQDIIISAQNVIIFLEEKECHNFCKGVS